MEQQALAGSGEPLDLDAGERRVVGGIAAGESARRRIVDVDIDIGLGLCGEVASGLEERSSFLRENPWGSTTSALSPSVP